MKIIAVIIRALLKFAIVRLSASLSSSIFCAIAIHSQSVQASEPVHIKHYVNNSSHLVTLYLTDVLIDILDKTVAEYGPYEIDYYRRPLSTNRLKLEAERGVLLDILFSGDWSGRFTNSKNVIQIEYPFFGELLGLRSIIVTQEMNAYFSSIQNLNELLQYRVGQGASWNDVEVLNANGIPVITAQLFDGLFPMLAKHRFDYVMLSVIEAEKSLQTAGPKYKNLVVNEDLKVFYPMPYYLYVNAAKPELAERLKHGLEIAKREGSIERLFEQHFAHAYKILEEKPRTLIYLKNPSMDDEANYEALGKLLARFPNSFRVAH